MKQDFACSVGHAGDRPVCQCHSAADAALFVAKMNLEPKQRRWQRRTAEGWKTV